MADILEKQRDPTSTISKRTYVHRANKPPKDPTYQNKSFKRIENFKPSNCRWKPDRSSSHNMHSEDNEENFKNVENKPKLKPELQSFIYVIKDFDLDDNKSSCFISS